MIMRHNDSQKTDSSPSEELHPPGFHVTKSVSQNLKARVAIKQLTNSVNFTNTVIRTNIPMVARFSRLPVDLTDGRFVTDSVLMSFSISIPGFACPRKP
jgi:hypothetical protein